jgi:hypothetical protein
MQIISPEDKEYYFGRISRAEAESILINAGLKNGLFLLRDSMIDIGSFALSICFEDRINHYKIERLARDNVKIDKGKEFLGPIELVNFFQTALDNAGLCTRPIYHCVRPTNFKPVKYLFISNDDLNKAIEDRIKKPHSSDAILSDFNYKYEKEALVDIHFSQKWCLKDLDSKEVNKLFLRFGYMNGKFLVRFKRFILITYKLSICYNDTIYHHKIIFENDKYYLEEEKHNHQKKFNYLAQLIDSYGRDKGSLECKLVMPYYIENNQFNCDSNRNHENLMNRNRLVERKNEPRSAYTGLSS